MKTIIEPTVGRIVWYYKPNRSEVEDQPLAAIITCVHNDRHVNLAVFSDVGKIKPTLTVQLLQEGEKLESDKDGYAIWMPYQIGQAAKAASTKNKKGIAKKPTPKVASVSKAEGKAEKEDK